LEIKNETTRIYQSGWCCYRRYDNNNIVFGRELFRGSLLSDKKPNIIFILADDLGIGEVSYNGADNYKTPNIDKLANRGTVSCRDIASGRYY
jgi:hypothetical protein